MTRSFGDVVAKSIGVCCEPEITSFPLTPEMKFLIIASDGLWDRLTNDEITRIVANDYYADRDALGAVNFLM